METNPLVELQKEAREKFWNLEEQEPEDYDKFLNELVAHVYRESLSDIEESLPEEKGPFSKVKSDEWGHPNGWNKYRAEILTTLHKKKELLGSV